LVLISHGADAFRHFAMRWGAILPVTRIEEGGLLGVRVFFGLSGLLITGRLLGEERRDGAISLSGFYLRRFFRILPAAALFLSAAGLLALAGVLPISLPRWLSALFCYANYSYAENHWYLGHFWSLAVEEHFYLLWPAAFLLLARLPRRVGLAVGLALAIALWRAADFKYRFTVYQPARFWGRTDIAGDGLVWAVVFALLVGDSTWRERLERWIKPTPVRATLAAVALGIAFLPSFGWKLSFFLITVQAIAIPALILGTVFCPGAPLGRLLETAPLRWVGRLSYSIYLWQQLFLVWDGDGAPAFGMLQSFPLNLAAALVCAVLSHYLVERPLVAVGHRLARERRSSARPAVVGPSR
jgi:peptidoglycan/LPS O-acetylase OafA/YrhL